MPTGFARHASTRSEPEWVLRPRSSSAAGARKGGEAPVIGALTSKIREADALGGDDANLSPAQECGITRPRTTVTAEIAVKLHIRNRHRDLGVGGLCTKVA
jgi:hypothetical protein